METVTPYKGNENYIFISYAHRDADAVMPILHRMDSDGYRVWFDRGIDPGTEWDENIAHHIDKCSYFIAFISKSYLASDNCKDELNFARDLSKKRLIVYLEDVELPAGMAMRMNRLQSIFRYRYTNDEDFYTTLYSSDGIEEFGTVTEPEAAKESDPDPDNNVITVSGPQNKNKWLVCGSVLTAFSVLLLLAFFVTLDPTEFIPIAAFSLSALFCFIYYKTGKFERIMLLCICLILGVYGVHRFMTKRYITGTIWCFTLGFLMVAPIVDAILIISGKFPIEKPNK